MAMGLWLVKTALWHPSPEPVGSASVRAQGNCQYIALYGTKANNSMRVAKNYFGSFLKYTPQMWLL